MKNLYMPAVVLCALTACASHPQMREESHQSTDKSIVQSIAQQRGNLARNTAGKGFGPQSPRDIDKTEGVNPVVFESSPAAAEMNLCNIHFHKNAEHAGGEFSRYAGDGDGHGFETGYVFTGDLSQAERTPLAQGICANEHGALSVGDTIELHYVHTSARIKPGPTLGACLSDSIKNPQLRVETQVYVLVNDSKALDFAWLTAVEQKNGLYQALNIPDNTGTPVTYAGSTTGPAYNEAGSPFQVTWSVRPKVAKVNADSVGQWCKSNIFNEDHAHGVRNLVKNPDLLSPIR
ncbi:MAG: delta-class carbonic anhydrase [Dokdonella sp.]